MAANLNASFSYTEIQALGAGVGRHIAAAFAAQDAGVTSDDRRRALGEESDCLEDIADVLGQVEAGDELAYAFRAFAIDHLTKQQTFTDELNTDEESNRAALA